jgi:mannan polymerase II complex MNN11 subunit
MHFALPPRKTSHPPPYVRNNALTAAVRRRKRIQILAYVVLTFLTVFLGFRVLRALFGAANHDGNGRIEGLQAIVIVTVFDETMLSEEYMRMVRTNRDDYAARHGMPLRNLILLY